MGFFFFDAVPQVATGKNWRTTIVSIRRRVLTKHPWPAPSTEQTLDYITSPHLEGDFSRHGEAVSDDGLFFGGAALPAVQLDAAAPGQEHLLVHLHRGVASELAG